MKDNAMRLGRQDTGDSCDEEIHGRGVREEAAMDVRKPGLKSPQKLSLLSSPVRAVIRLRRTAHALKKTLLPQDPQANLLQRQFSLGRAKACGAGAPSLLAQSSFETSQYFTFDTSVQPPVVARSGKRKKRSKNPRVLYPVNSRKYLPTEHKSKAKRCLLLLVAIVCFQILNAIENLDDNLLRYDLEALEKTMSREVFGQAAATENLVALLKDYLATHIHNKPLVVSFHGPSGVGKSHVGRLLAKHFRSVVGPDSVLHYFAQHHCPEEAAATACQRELSATVGDMVTRAEAEERIPLFILDEVESMPPAVLDTLGGLFRTNQTNEFLNAIYILISNLGGGEVTHLLLQNGSSGDLLPPQKTFEELRGALRPVLHRIHPLWTMAEIVPFALLEKSHVRRCFYEEMMSEGIYPEPGHVERLAGQLSYYAEGDQQFAVTGCKQVVATVNLL